jgi:hypothetical protein
VTNTLESELTAEALRYLESMAMTVVLASNDGKVRLKCSISLAFVEADLSRAWRPSLHKVPYKDVSGPVEIHIKGLGTSGQMRSYLRIWIQS